MDGSESSKNTTKAAPFPKKPRAKFGRSVSGCLVCRSRRKKCNEEHPTCAACKRNKLRCEWPAGLTEHRAVQCRSKDIVRLPKGSRLNFTLLRTLSVSAPARVQCTLSLTQSSTLLFQHYYEHTSTLITVLSNEENAFQTHVIELALADSLLLHTIIAVSGVHLNFNNEAALEIRQATSAHYTTALNEIRKELDTSTPLSQTSCYRLALILVLVAHVEAISAEPTGDIYPHLRAVHQLLDIADKQSPSKLSTTDITTKGLVLETYAYLSIISHITPYGLLPARTLPLDKVVTDLSHLRKYRTYGSFFSCGHDVFELIPQIAVLARECLFEIRDNGSPSPTSLRIEIRLRGQLETLLAEESVFQGAALATRKIYCHILFLFLETAMCGSNIDLSQLQPRLQPHIDSAMLLAPSLNGSNFGTLMLWPLVIWASCCIRQSDKDVLRAIFDHPRKYRMNQVVAAGKILYLLWESNDPNVFGPYGLYLMMRKHKINLSMA